MWLWFDGEIFGKKITQITITMNGGSNPITITENRQKITFPIKWSLDINTLFTPHLTPTTPPNTSQLHWNVWHHQMSFEMSLMPPSG